jgi:ATP-dependent protease ClpP protease subunit
MSEDYYSYIQALKNHTEMVQEDKATFVYLTDEIESPRAYNALLHKLYTATKDDTFTFIINSGGGVVESVIMLTDAIIHSAATVKMKVAGFAASASTVLALAGDELEIANHSTFMIHNYSSSGISGKGHELVARQNFMNKSLNDAFNFYYQGFLTPEEIEKVIGGSDLWMGPEEVRERWLNKQALKE